MTAESKADREEGASEGAPSPKVALRTGQIVLAIEAAGNACSVAVGRVTPVEPEILACENRDMQHGQAALLVPMIAAVMAKADLAMEAIEAIAVGIGPGGFTGLRIALSTARGLGLALGAPVIGISSFQAAAATLSPAARGEGDIVVLLDSRRSEPYAAWLGSDLSLRATPILLDEAGLTALLQRAAPATVTGDGLTLWPHAWPLGSTLHPAGGDAAAVLRLAADHSARFQMPALPIYLREPDVSLPKAG